VAIALNYLIQKNQEFWVSCQVNLDKKIVFNYITKDFCKRSKVVDVVSRQNIQSPLDLGKSQTTYPQVFYPPLLQSFLKQQQLIYPRYAKPEPPRTIWDIRVSFNLIYPIGGLGLFILGFVTVVKGLSLSQIAFGLISWCGVIWGLQQFIGWWGRQRKQYYQEIQVDYKAQLKQWQRANKVRDRYPKNSCKY
jgi:hypothetical protein